MDYRLLPKSRPPVSVAASRPTVPHWRRVAFLWMLMLTTALVLPMRVKAGVHFNQGNSSIRQHPTIQKPWTEINLMFYDTEGKDGYFLHTKTANGKDGPAIWVNGNYICSPDWELAWPANDGNADGLDDERGNNGWWGSTYTKNVNGTNYTVRFYDPRKQGNRFFVTVVVYQDRLQMGSPMEVKIGGTWRINSTSTAYEELAFKTNPIENLFKSSPYTAERTGYGKMRINGTLPSSYGAGDYQVDVKMQAFTYGFMYPPNTTVTKTFQAGAKYQFDLDCTEDDTYDNQKLTYSVQHRLIVKNSGHPDIAVWATYPSVVPEYVRADKVTTSFDQWKKEMTLAWTETSKKSHPGSWSVYRYPKGQPNQRTLIVSNLLYGTNKYTDKVPDYDETYTYEVAFVPTGTPSGTRLERLVRSVDATSRRNFAISMGEVIPGKSSITLKWSAQEFKGTPPFSYTILRQSTDGEDWQEIRTERYYNKTLTEFSYTDEYQLNTCPGYRYKVTSTLLDGYLAESGASEFVQLTGQSKVTSVTASKGDYKGVVKVTWEADQTDSKATTFELMRRTKGTTTWAVINKVSGTSTTYYYEDNTAQPGQYYDYKVVSTTMCGSSEVKLEAGDEGFCRATGIVSGRISYGTGTAVRDARVSLVRNNESDNDVAQFYAVRTEGAGDGILLDLDGQTLDERFRGKDFTVQLFVRPDESQTGSAPVFFDLGGRLSLRLGRLTENGYRVVLAQEGKADTTAICLPTRDYTSLTLSVTGTGVARLTAIDKRDTVTTAEVPGIANAAFSDGGLCFGGSYASSVETAFSGYVDEMRVFCGKSLTQEDILRNYNHTLSGTEDNLFIYWPVDEGIVGQSLAYDYSKTSGVANGHHGRFGIATRVTSTVVPDSIQLSLFAYTDGQGNFVVRGVPFNGDGTNYVVVPALGTHEFSPSYSSRYVSASSLVHSGVDFTDVSSFPVSGIVIYEGTDYPVEGCSFYVDGNVCSKDGQLVTTKEDGKFTISVPIGDHFVEVRKDGHVFAAGGRYPQDPNGTGERLTFKEPVKNLEFRDQTLVNFSGRVVGGSIEGDKPLGFAQSVNNIGVTEIVMRPNVNLGRLNVVKDTVGTTYSYEVNPDSVAVASATVNINSRAWRGAGSENCSKIFIRTDAATGEFSALVPPLNYSIESMQVVATGNSVGEPTVVDLSNPRMEYTDSVSLANGETDKYTYHYGMKRTYHSAPSFVVTQEGNENGAFGLQSYQIEDAEGAIDITDICAVDPNGKVSYKYGGAIFESEENYIFHIKAFEEYLNCDVKGDTVSYEVPLAGSEVVINNALSAEQMVYMEGNPDGKDAGSIMKMESNALTLDSLGRATYVWKAGLPNITPPYSRTISMSYDVDGRTYNWDGSGMAGIILGALPTGNNFVTAGPDMVDMILRDPPGSLSSAQWTSGTVTSRSTTNGDMWDSESSVETHTRLGLKLATVSGFGVSLVTESESKADVDVGVLTKTEGENATTWSRQVSTTRTISTSAEPEYVGPNGDVFVGTSTNLVFGKARDVNFRRVNVSGNAVQLGLEDIVTTGLEFKTAFNYTAYYIENTLLPNLEALRNGHLQTVSSIEGHDRPKKNPVYLTTLSSDDERFGSNNHDKRVWGKLATKGPSVAGPSYTMIVPNDNDCYEDSVLWCNTQIENWKRYLRLNEQEKVEAHDNKSKTLVQNVSFDSGTSITATTEQEESRGTTYDCTVTGSAVLGLSTGYAFNKVGFYGTVSTTTGGGTHDAKEDSETQLASFSYTLAESGDDDALSVDVYNHGAYSPIFRTIAGQTSGPYEGKVESKYLDTVAVIMEATMQIEVPQIDVDVPVVTNVPTGSPANYTLRLKNASEIDEDVYYKLLMMDETNPDGAKITIDGMPLTDNRIIKIPAGETVTKSLQLYQTQLGVRDYKDIGIVLASQSQYDPTSIWEQIADTVYITAQFIPSSSAVTMSLDKRTINTTTGTDLNISFSQFDRNYNNLKAFRLQYSKQGDTDWTQLHEYVLHAEDKTQNNELLPGDATVKYKFPMAAYDDGVYRFRILSVATYGTEEVYNQSEEIAVVKDTKRPQPLGQPLPSNGVLGAGDELSILFNENILKDELSERANFRVTGVLNGAPVDHAVALDMSVDGTAAATDADITLRNRSFSIDAWVNIDSEGTLISHGNGAEKFEIGTDAQGRLSVTIGADTYTSAKALPRNEWLYLTTSYAAGPQPLLQAAYADANTEVTLFRDEPVCAYNGQGKLAVGTGAKGALHELTLWDEAHDLATALLGKSKTKRPATPHLIGYWKMDEGEGTVATDYARNRHLRMATESWRLDNDNLAASLDGTSHLDITTSAIAPMADDNCAIELWMRGGKQEGEAEIFQSGEVELWIDPTGKLNLSSLGNDYEAAQVSLLDNAWHHVALNILRTGHASVYVDGKRTFSTSAANVGQTASDRLIVGARRTQGTESQYVYDRRFKGEVDEVRLWNATLTADLLKSRRKMRLTGKEDGLAAYYPFEVKTLDSENQIVTQGTAKDLTGSGNEAVYESGTGLAYTDNAPALRPSQTETNVGFSFTASDNKVVFSLDEAPADIEGCTLHFTVLDVRDLNGNYSKPVCWSAYVNRNELTWDAPTLSVRKHVGDEAHTEASFTNKGGKQQAWSLSGLPAWLSADMEEGTAEPLTTTTIGLDIAPGTPIGTYEETVYLTGNDNIASPLTVRLSVVGDVPAWGVDPSGYENTMSLVGTLSILGDPSNDPEDMVAAFVGGECRGVAHPVYNARYDSYFVLLDIYGNSEDSGKPVVFYAYDSSTGVSYPELTTSQQVGFRANQVAGSYAAPVVLNAEDLVEQTRSLGKGWNWTSYYVRTDDMGVDKFFEPVAAQTEVVKSKSEFGTFENGSFFGKPFDIDNRSMYKVRMATSQLLRVVGRRPTAAERTLTIQPGWNWIAYNAPSAASVADALAGMEPQDGDLVKGQQGFAMFDGYEWNGSLKALLPGQGYMLQSVTADVRSFDYPTHAAPFTAPALAANEGGTFTPVDHHKYSGNMCLVAYVTWDGTPADDCEVGVFDDSDCRAAERVGQDGFAYFTIPGDGPQTLRFMMPHDGRIYVSDVTVGYEEDAVIGTHNAPLCIPFLSSSGSYIDAAHAMLGGDEQWYTLSGQLLGGKPTVRGVYVRKTYNQETHTVTTQNVAVK